MATIAEIYGFGARAVYATPRASEYDMKERVRLSGMFPRVGNEPLSKALARIVEEFEQNANFAAIVERHRALIDRARVGRAIDDASAPAVQQVMGRRRSAITHQLLRATQATTIDLKSCRAKTQHF